MAMAKQVARKASRTAKAKTAPGHAALPMVDVLARRTTPAPAGEMRGRVHLLKKGLICDTEAPGHVTPGGQKAVDIVVNVSNGRIALWAPGTTLRWRFRERSFSGFANPDGLKALIRQRFGEALLQWGVACPVRFTEDSDVWDFEIMMLATDECTVDGCVLASAFFPDGGRHALRLYPMLFQQAEIEQVETLAHEIGHIFGLRHFFAPVSEKSMPSEQFGTQSKFSIMNYGALSTMTDADRNDLQELYRQVWSGERKEINGTEVILVRPYSALGSTEIAMPVRATSPAAAPLREAAAMMPAAELVGTATVAATPVRAASAIIAAERGEQSLEELGKRVGALERQW